MYFQTRSQADTERLIQVLETDLPQMPATIRTRLVEHNLAASLVRYGQIEFTHATVEDHRKNLAWVQALPQPIFTILGDALVIFDEKIKAVFAEGWTENF